MSEIGKDVRRRLKLEPVKVVVVEDRYYTYACRRCEKENMETPVVQKFVMGSPLYRQEQELKRGGVLLSRQIR